MRKMTLLILLFFIIICACDANKQVSSGIISTPVSVENSNIALTSNETYYEEYFISLINNIPADNGDEISYVEALEIGGRIYSGSKNKIISFKEGLSDLQVIYENPNSDLYYEQMILFNENTICVRFLNSAWRYDRDDIQKYTYMLINLTDHSETPVLSGIKGLYNPFKGLSDSYYINMRRMDDNYDARYEYDLYKVNPSGKDKLLIAGFEDEVILKKGVYLIDYPETNDDNNSTVYFFDFATQKLNKVMEIKNLWAFQVSGDYILYSAGAYTQAYLYNIVNKTTVFLNEKLGIEFSVDDADIRNEHFFVIVYHEDTKENEISDINMTDLKIAEADKMNLPGYIGGWKYYMIQPSESGDEEHEEEYYTLWRHDWNDKKQFVY